MTYSGDMPEEYEKSYNLSARIKIVFKTAEFKYIAEVQAYPAWSFMAEVGGYAGLFLGFSILQFPQLIKNTFDYIMDKIRILFEK